MPPKSLLRHIFRHGPNSDRHSIPSASNNNHLDCEQYPSNRDNALHNSPLFNDSRSSTPPLSDIQETCYEDEHEVKDNEQLTTSSPLPHSVSYSSNANTSSPSYCNGKERDATIGDKDNSPASNNPSSNLPVHISHADALETARYTLLSHMDTLHTTLLFLDALDGFSGTITEVRVEMEEKMRECEDMLRSLGEGGLKEERHEDVNEEDGEDEIVGSGKISGDEKELMG